jgi:hypothetical protein
VGSVTKETQIMFRCKHSFPFITLSDMLEKKFIHSGPKMSGKKRLLENLLNNFEMCTVLARLVGLFSFLFLDQGGIFFMKKKTQEKS